MKRLQESLGFDLASTGSWYHQNSLGKQTTPFARFIHYVPIGMPRTRSECIRLGRRVSRVRRRPWSLKSPKKVNGTSEMAEIVTRLVSASEIVGSAGAAMVATVVSRWTKKGGLNGREHQFPNPPPKNDKNIIKIAIRSETYTYFLDQVLYIFYLHMLCYINTVVKKSVRLFLSTGS